MGGALSRREPGRTTKIAWMAQKHRGQRRAQNTVEEAARISGEVEKNNPKGAKSGAVHAADPRVREPVEATGQLWKFDIRNKGPGGIIYPSPFPEIMGKQRISKDTPAGAPPRDATRETARGDEALTQQTTVILAALGTQIATLAGEVGLTRDDQNKLKDRFKATEDTLGATAPQVDKRDSDERQMEGTRIGCWRKQYRTIKSRTESEEEQLPQVTTMTADLLG
ncbi:hypothetical protein NDU88_006896 [Pleurodeles waltl]|uniref:Uncharacterized protein n=1 Tax=Pleurodeles waltl TaxID=8319 RepID=A0AAV7WG42_PLEWA|nr:hypothetical protein NDU88_006896 [Pleurodeles waltl]